MTMTIPLTLGVGSLLEHVVWQPLFHIGPIPVNNHQMMMTVAAVVLVISFVQAARGIGARAGNTPDAYVPRGRFSQIVEVILLYLRDEVTRPALGKLTDKYIGYVWTTFFFILFMNLVGMVPFGYAAQLIATALGADHHTVEHLAHFQGTATGNINVTGALAVVSFFMIFWVGIKQQGLHYFAHYAPVPFDASPMIIVAMLLVLLEILGAFIKPFALAMRLFANMLAGHMVLGALIGLIFIAAAGMGTVGGYATSIPVIAGSVAMSLLELFVAFLQSYIFAFLTVLFIAQGAIHHDPGHEIVHSPEEILGREGH